jgi:hypothetical protein
MNVISSPNKTTLEGPDLFCSALDVALLIIARSTFHPDWARDNVGAKVVQQLVQSLISAANGPHPDVRLDKSSPRKGRDRSSPLSSLTDQAPLYPCHGHPRAFVPYCSSSAVGLPAHACCDSLVLRVTSHDDRRRPTLWFTLSASPERTRRLAGRLEERCGSAHWCT